MGFIDKIINVTLGRKNDINSAVGVNPFGALTSGSGFKSMESVATVYTCAKVLAETIAKLPLEVYKNDPKKGKQKQKSDYRYNVLHRAPNGYTTAFEFWRSMEFTRNLRGNAYAWIRRQGLKSVTFEYLHPDNVTDYKIQNGELYYKIRGRKAWVNASQILHFRMSNEGGIMGFTPITALRRNLSINWQAFNTIENFYKNNATTPKALKSTMQGVANTKLLEQALEKWDEKNNGSANSGKIITLPPNAELQELSVSFADAQFIETIKFNDRQIASLYGLSPYQIGDFEASKFNNVEQLGLNFKSNTIEPIARMYRQELEHKLLATQELDEGLSIEFNLLGLVETDERTKAEAIKTQFNTGAISPNEIAKIYQNETVEGGDKRFIPVNMQDVSNPVVTKEKNQNNNENE